MPPLPTSCPRNSLHILAINWAGVTIEFTLAEVIKTDLVRLLTTLSHVCEGPPLFALWLSSMADSKQLVEFVLLRVHVILQEHLCLVVHFRINILTEKTAD